MHGMYNKKNVYSEINSNVTRSTLKVAIEELEPTY